MFDYAEELRTNEQFTAHEAIFESAKRRMRPIFLTSAAASMGVIPMILGGSGLWMPMGVVIFFGTLITMVLILTVLPVAYWLMMSGSTKKRIETIEAIETIEKTSKQRTLCRKPYYPQPCSWAAFRSTPSVC